MHLLAWKIKCFLWNWPQHLDAYIPEPFDRECQTKYKAVIGCFPLDVENSNAINDKLESTKDHMAVATNMGAQQEQ